MATGNVVVNVLYFGQGQCNFVEVYDQASPPNLIHTFLFDCGNHGGGTQELEFQANLNYIATTAKRKSGTVKIDAVFLSHGDKDHYNKLFELVGSFLEEDGDEGKVPEKVINKLYFGGIERDYKGLFTRTYKNGGISDCVNNICSLQDDSTEDLYDKDGILVFSMIANVLTAKQRDVKKKKEADDSEKALNSPVLGLTPDSDPITSVSGDEGEQESPKASRKRKKATGESDPEGTAKNRESLVCVLEYRGQRYTFCGDATFATFAYVNSIWGAHPRHTQLNNSEMVTLPHHGSYRTATENHEKKNKPKEEEVVIQFAKNLAPKTVTASAYVPSHGHPSLWIVNQFKPTDEDPWIQDNRLKEEKSHLAVIYNDIILTKPTEPAPSTEVDGGEGSSSSSPSNKVTKNKYYNFLLSQNAYATLICWQEKAFFKYKLGEDVVEKAYKGTKEVVKESPEVPFSDCATWQYITNKDGNTTLAGWNWLGELGEEKIPGQVFTSFIRDDMEETPGLEEGPASALNTLSLSRKPRPPFRHKVQPPATQPSLFGNTLKHHF